jgi:hypothetical protein
VRPSPRACDWPELHDEAPPRLCCPSCRYALELPPWCAIAVADSGRQTVERVAELLDLSVAGVRKIEARALRRFEKRFQRVAAAYAAGGDEDE